MPKESITLPNDVHRAFAHRVRALRIEREWSQAHLASKVTAFGVPIDRTAVARIEQAAIESESKLKPRKVTIDEAYGFALALGVPLGVLLPYDESGFDDSEPVTREYFDAAMKRLVALVADLRDQQVAKSEKADAIRQSMRESRARRVKQ